MPHHQDNIDYCVSSINHNYMDIQIVKDDVTSMKHILRQVLQRLNALEQQVKER